MRNKADWLCTIKKKKIPTLCSRSPRQQPADSKAGRSPRQHPAVVCSRQDPEAKLSMLTPGSIFNELCDRPWLCHLWASMSMSIKWGCLSHRAVRELDCVRKLFFSGTVCGSHCFSWCAFLETSFARIWKNRMERGLPWSPKAENTFSASWARLMSKWFHQSAREAVSVGKWQPNRLAGMQGQAEAPWKGGWLQ